MIDCYQRNSHIYIYDWRTNIQYTYEQSRFWESRWILEPMLNNEYTKVPNTYILLKAGRLPVKS